MKFFVMVDMEGISGIVKSTQIRSGEVEYARARQYLCQDVNACVDGLFAGGATAVVVRDTHSTGFNFIFDMLDPRAEYLQGNGGRPRMPDIAHMDGLVLLGYHAMAGTDDAVLEHTMSSKTWQNFWLNDKLAGEIAIDAGIAGDAGVPTILVTGCDKTCHEARQFIPDVITASVKTGFGCEYARLLPLPRAQALIRQKATEAVRACRTIKPLIFKPPVRMRLELVERGQAPDFGNKPYFKKLDSRTYEVQGASVSEAMERL
ncbi:MAG: M55 family metallopeptidase [Planctomycetota bacterium]